jgi:hypothetical protein
MARRHGGRPSLFAALSLAAACLLPPAAGAAETGGSYSLASRSLLLGYEREDAGGNKSRFLPVYEYLSLDAIRVGGSPVSARFYGWGRLDLADDTGSGPQGGDVGSFYVEYRHPTGNAEARAGRFFLAEGGAFETLDGAFVKGTFPGGVGLSLFGGVPVEQAAVGKRGDSLYGGRAFYGRKGAGELGISALQERGDFREKDNTVSDRSLASADLWMRLGSLPAEVSGRIDWNLATNGIARTQATLRGRPAPSVDVALRYDGYDTGDLSHGTTNAPFLRPTPSYSLDDSVDALSLVGSWAATPSFTAEWALKALHHSFDTVGDALVGTVGGRYAYNAGKDAAGADVTLCNGDAAADRFTGYRLFATWSPGKARLTVDAVADLYKQEVFGKKESYVATATASWDVAPSVRVGGEGTWSDGPRLSNDLSVLAKISIGFDSSKGGSR